MTQSVAALPFCGGNSTGECGKAMTSQLGCLAAYLMPFSMQRMTSKVASPTHRARTSAQEACARPYVKRTLAQERR